MPAAPWRPSAGAIRSKHPSKTRPARVRKRFRRAKHPKCPSKSFHFRFAIETYQRVGADRTAKIIFYILSAAETSASPRDSARLASASPRAASAPSRRAARSPASACLRPPSSAETRQPLLRRRRRLLVHACFCFPAGIDGAGHSRCSSTTTVLRTYIEHRCGCQEIVGCLGGGDLDGGQRCDPKRRGHALRNRQRPELSTDPFPIMAFGVERGAALLDLQRVDVIRGVGFQPGDHRVAVTAVERVVEGSSSRRMRNASSTSPRLCRMSAIWPIVTARERASPRRSWTGSSGVARGRSALRWRVGGMGFLSCFFQGRLATALDGSAGGASAVDADLGAVLAPTGVKHARLVEAAIGVRAEIVA
jgi:hypothetical protein